MGGAASVLGAAVQDGWNRKTSVPVNLNESFGEEINAFLIDEKELHSYDDLTKVNPVTTKTVLKCLQARYAAKLFYTNAGCTVIAINPFQPIEKLYSTEIMKQYHNASHPQNLKPHIFPVAEQAYRNVQCQIHPVNQSIVVSGESGAGKTWTSRCLMKFYATVAGSNSKCNQAVEKIESRVLDSNPLMEAFGNACTLRNSNSSRFGKYIQLQLSRTQQIMGASIRTYLLEKTRVTHQAPLERNFHIFYQIVKGASPSEREEWNLRENVQFSWLPNTSKNLDEDCFEVTKAAMTHLGIDSSTQSNIFKILSGLLHLGNVTFCDSPDEIQPCDIFSDAKDFIYSSSNLLKIPAEHLLDRLRNRTITAGKQQALKKPCKKVECDSRRDCLAKSVYARLFDWLVTVINESICAESTAWNNFIGLLDVYGFESFPQNNLEQLCINYANEKLQQHFVTHYLKVQQDEYTAEGLEWSFISYQDNQECVDLIDGNPVSIFSFLNEECRLNRSSVASQLQSRFEKSLSHNKCFGWDKFNGQPNFIISHYAGKVTYVIEDMVIKNKDPVPPELIQLLQESTDVLLQKLFPTENNKPADLSSYTRTTPTTVVSKFKGSLESLMHILHNTTPHYIRCIKPNMDCKAMDFRKEEVLSQLEACGIVETINISAAGFPIRISFQSFVERYSLVAPRQSKTEMTNHLNVFLSDETGRGLNSKEGVQELQLICQNILQTMLPSMCVDTTSKNILAHCGTTKVFLTHMMIDALEKERERAFSLRAFCIQCCWRRYRQRKLARQRRAATIIQAVVKGWLTRNYVERMRRAVTVIKMAWKKWKEKLEALAAVELDDTSEMESLHSTASSPVKASHFSTMDSTQDSSMITNEMFQSWILGLVLSRTPPIRKTVMSEGFKRHLYLVACLNVLSRNNGYRVEVNRSEHGITSIRAPPQRTVKFHCKRSPLQFANMCPETLNCGVSGFNEILLERVK
ncbi:unconventional myosin-XIX [Gastrophryne carolinensis]